MMTAQRYGLETADERLRRISITKTLCLGAKITMTAEKIIGKMSRVYHVRFKSFLWGFLKNGHGRYGRFKRRRLGLTYWQTKKPLRK